MQIVKYQAVLLIGNVQESYQRTDPDRILYHFGFDWMAIVPSSIGQNEEVFKRLRLRNKEIPVSFATFMALSH